VDSSHLCCSTGPNLHGPNPESHLLQLEELLLRQLLAILGEVEVVEGGKDLLNHQIYVDLEAQGVEQGTLGCEDGVDNLWDILLLQ
jgi:hypothetical protein